MTLFEIKHRTTGAVLFSLECSSLKLCVEAAVAAKADLGSADLGYADLGYANLGYANLRSADLGSADLGSGKLIGERPFLSTGPLGSRSDYLLAFITDNGLYVRAGCFFDTLDKFKAAVTETHGDSLHGREYAAACAMIEAHAAIWTPKDGEG